MRYLKIYTAFILLFTTASLAAQEKPSEVTKEVTEKTLKTTTNDGIVENSVRITTEIQQAVMTDPEDEGKIDGDRIFPPKTVIKTVEIDNDDDSMYDETITFSYTTNNRTDFTLVTNRDEIMIAVEEGNNITVLENQKMFKQNENDKTSYIYTDEEGEKIEFRIENEMTARGK